LDVTARAPADLTLDLVVEIFEPDALTLLDRVSLNDASEPDPGDATRVHARLRAAARGEASTVYYVRVTAAEGRAELDPALGGYSLDVTLLADPDPQEAGGGNDLPEDATALPVDTVLSGSLATRADQDLFVLTPPGAPSATNPQVLFVEVSFDAT